MKRELRNVSASVYQRLRNRARERGEAVPLVHQRYAAERILYRIAQSPHRDRFVLRGGMLYELWGGEAYRSTNDLDLLGYGSAEPGQVEACFRDLVAVEVPDDGLRFQPDGIRVRGVREEAEYSGVEVKLELRLKTARIPLKVDVGFGDVIVPGPEEVDYPALLDGPAASIRAYSRESV
ncbi:MAG: nucleotidyl transferase AbiEii/AbiGii toxin family protein, partial [bacterium]|nr:nucleotidyl transferase AbiEii/AbiGii toxin family protein [bacterium]